MDISLRGARLLSQLTLDIGYVAANITGDIAAARMSANVVTAIAGSDPTLSSVTIDAQDGIKRNVTNASLQFAGGTTITNGAYLLLIGGFHTTSPGDVHIYLGNKTAGAILPSEFKILYNADGGEATIFVVDAAGNITTVGTVDGRDVVADGTKLDTLDMTKAVYDPDNNGFPEGIELTAAASDVILKADDAEDNWNNQNWWKQAELPAIPSAITGTFRITFEMKCLNGQGGNLARVYKNGVPHGTEQTTTSTTYVSKSEDLAFVAGDLIQLYVYAGSGDILYTKEFRAKGSYSATKEQTW